MLISILGRKRHGKNTLANIIQSYNKNYIIDAFGDDLKTLIIDIFKNHVPDKKFLTEEYKDQNFNTRIHIDKFLPKIEDKTGLKLFPQGKVAFCYRDLLTLVGTEYIRSVDDYYWVNKVVDRVKRRSRDYWNKNTATDANVIVADVRFRIEAEALQKLGAKLIKIFKINHENYNSRTDPSFTHRSETEQDGIIADLTIGSLHNNLTIPTIVGFHIANNQWEEALKYNWAERY